MRKIVFDIETTGLHHEEGHKIVELGCVELNNEVRTGKEWQTYLNPERDIEAEAEQVHGITNQMVANKPKFADVLESFLDFIGTAQLVAHNADFDRGFINAEIAKVDKDKVLTTERFIDTLPLAQRRFASGRVDLSTLCDRFHIKKNREKHGALLDAQLLAEVYIELLQPEKVDTEMKLTKKLPTFIAKNPEQKPLVIQPSAEEKQQHQAFIKTLATSIWTS